MNYGKEGDLQNFSFADDSRYTVSYITINHRIYSKFRGLNFGVFDWKENLWGINFHGHGGMVGTIIGFATYASSYCGVVFVDKRHTTKCTKIDIPQKFLRVR